MKWERNHKYNTEQLNSPSNQQQTKDIFTLSASFLPIYAARAVPTWAVGKFSEILETSKTPPNNNEMLAKKVFSDNTMCKKRKHHHCLFTASLLCQDDHVQRCSRTTHTESAWSIDANGIVCGLGIVKLITNLNEKRPSSVFSTLRLNFADNFPSYRRIIK